MVQFILNNGCRLVGMHYVCKNVGVELSLDTGQKVVTVFMYAQGADGFQPYQGELPHGLTWRDRRRDVEAKLDRPSATGGGGTLNVWASYQSLRMQVAYNTFNPQDMNAPLFSVQIR